MEDNGEKRLMLFTGMITYGFFTQSYCKNLSSVTDLSRDNRFPSRSTFLLAFSLNYFLTVFLTSLRWAVVLKEIISLNRIGVTSKPGPHPGRFWVSPRTDWTDPALNLAFICQVLQQLCGHALDSLQYVSLSFPRTPKADWVLQMWSPKCCRERNNYFAPPVG